MKFNYKKYFVFKLIILFLLMQFSGYKFNPNIGLFAQNNQTCSDNLEKAEDAYYDGEFNESLRLISVCLKQTDISYEERSQAYVILSKTFMSMENTEKAKEYVNKILDIDPNYLPTIEQEIPKYVNLVIMVRKEREQQNKLEEESGISSWIWIGAGGVVATATVIAIISSGDEKKDNKDNTLPQPPAFP